MTPLHHLLNPRSIAVIGASNDPKRIGGRPIDLLKRNYSGEIYPINLSRPEIQGIKAYSSLLDVEKDIDLALIALPAPIVNDALKDCIKKGIDACIIMSSGFAEEGEAGTALQDEIIATAREGGIRIIGPNCIGVGNNKIGSWATFAGGAEHLPPVGELSVITQSGGFASLVLSLLKQRNIGLNHWIAFGNQCDVDFSECLEYLATDPDTKVILGYLEGIRDGNKLANALKKARENGKPVVIVKVGSSEAGAIAAASHTATLAGEDALYDAVLKQYGAYRAETVEEAMQVAYTCLNAPALPKGGNLCVYTISGGFGVLMADAASRAGLKVPALPEEVQDNLRELLPFSSVRNPIDTTAQLLNDFSLVEKSMEIVSTSGNCDMLACYLVGLDNSPALQPKIYAVLKSFREKNPEAIVALVLSPTPEIREGYEKLGYLVFEDASEPMRPLAALRFFGQSFTSHPAEVSSIEPFSNPSSDKILDETTAKKIISDAGVPIPKEALVSNRTDAMEAAAQIGGPIAMKIVSPDLLHKSDIGGVELSLEDPEEVGLAYDRIIENIRRNAPNARINGVLVSPMISDGLEFSLGIQNDAVFGPMLMVGLGGIFIEIMQDVSFRKAPVSKAEAQSMLAELRGQKILHGVRGKPPADIEGLVDAIVALGDFAVANASQIDSVDINPLLVLPQGKGVVAVDAVIALKN